MELTVALPDIKPLADVNDNYLREMLIANLYHIGKLSEKEARDVLGKSRREFEELLPKFGFSILGDSPSNLVHEVNA